MIYAFDVDGTLTEPRQSIDRKFLMFMKEFAYRNKVILVSGSDYSKIEEQVGELMPYCEAIYANSGNSKYEQVINFDGELDWIGVHQKFDWPEDLIPTLNQLLEDSKYEYRFGTHIEERPGMINFSVCGRDANKEDRKDYYEWDKKSNERDFICAHIWDMYDGAIDCVKGGEISVDIYPVGKDKSQILDSIKDRVHFFGDRIHMGGNDHTLAMRIIEEGGTVSSVKDWRDTWQILRTNR